MSQTIEQRIDELATCGQLVYRSAFSVDRDKARQKMQRYQRANPYEYVLEFVQAAHLLGASRVVVTIDSDEMDMRFDGQWLTMQDGHDLYAAAFAPHSSTKERALKHLAHGITAARAIGTMALTIESGDHHQAMRLTVATGKDDELVACQRDRAGTRLYLKEALRPRHLGAFLKYINGTLATIELIRWRCIYSPIPVILNGEQVNVRKLEDLGDMQDLGFVRVETPEATGVLSLRPFGVKSGVKILHHGVYVAEVVPSLRSLAVFGVVNATGLTMDLSRVVVQTDANWKNMVAQAIDASLHRLIFESLTALTTAQQRTEAWARTAMMDVLAQCGVWRDQGRALPPDTLRLAKWIEDIPLWQAADAVPGSVRYRHTLVSMRQLGVGLDQRAPLYFSRLREHVIQFETDRHLLLPRAGELALLTSYLQVEAVDQTEALRLKIIREQNIARWQRRVAVAGLSWEDFPHQNNVCIPGDVPLTVRVGVRARGPTHSVLRVIHDGRVLVERPLESFFLRRLEIVFDGHFQPTYTFDDVEEDHTWVACALAAMSMLPELIAAYMHTTTYWDSRLVEPWLEHYFSGRAHKLFLHAFHLDRAQITTALDVWWRWHNEMNSPWSAIALFRDGLHNLEAAQTRLHAIGEVADVPLFKRLKGPQLSLWQLYEQARDEGHVRYITPEAQMSAMRQLRMIRDEMPQVIDVIVVHDHEMLRLLNIFGRALLLNYESMFIHLAGRANLMRQSPRPMMVEALGASARQGMPSLGTWTLDLALMKGQIACLQATEIGHGRVDVHFHYERRFVVRFDVPVAFGHFVACVDSTSLKIDASWRDIVRDADFDVFCAHIKQHAQQCIIHMVNFSVVVRRQALDAQMFLFLVRWIEAVCLFDVHIVEQTSRALVHALRHVPIFRLGKRRASFDHVCQRLAGAEDVYYSTVAQDEDHVLVVPPDLNRPGEVLGRLFPDKYRILPFEDHRSPNEILQQALVLFMGRAIERPDPTLFMETLTHHEDDVRYQVGCLPDEHGILSAQIDVILCHQQRRVATLTLPCSLGRFEVWVDDPGLIDWSQSTALLPDRKRVHLQEASRLVEVYVAELVALARSDEQVRWLIWLQMARLTGVGQSALAMLLFRAPLFETTHGMASANALREEDDVVFCVGDVAVEDTQQRVCRLPALRWYRPFSQIFEQHRLIEYGEAQHLPSPEMHSLDVREEALSAMDEDLFDQWHHELNTMIELYYPALGHCTVTIDEMVRPLRPLGFEGNQMVCFVNHPLCRQLMFEPQNDQEDGVAPVDGILWLIPLSLEAIHSTDIIDVEPEVERARHAYWLERVRCKLGVHPSIS